MISRTKRLITLLVLGLLLLSFGQPGQVFADQESPENPYYQVETVTLADGTEMAVATISGPPEPPAGFTREVVDSPELDPNVTIISNVPAFDWSFGCSATSAAMIAGYYDRNGYPNMYAGPTNGSIMTLDNSSWGYWTDSNGDSRAQCPLSATRNGVDGRSTRGSVDDYWVYYASGAEDPYVTNVWTEHTLGGCTGDYMKTNRKASGNDDGSTSFYYLLNNPSQITCAALIGGGVGDIDGTVGYKYFYESRGYTVDSNHCYYQLTENQVAGGFSFADYKAEIDDGYPVMIHVVGHTMVGVGYNSSTSEVILHDTWGYTQHSMTWGADYVGMDLTAVSVVRLESWEHNSTMTGNWNTGATWDAGTVPTSSDDVTVKTGHTVTINTTAQCANLTVQPGATLVVANGATLTVEENIYNNGTLRQVQDVPSGSTTEFLHIQNSASAVVYRGLDLTPSGAMGTTTVEFNGNQTNGCTSVQSDELLNRCYTITPGTDQTATVRFWYTEDERNGEDANALGVWHHDGGTTWSSTGSSPTYSESGTECTSGTRPGFECWVQATNISSYSTFALGSGAVPTALNLQNLAAQSNPAIYAALATASILIILGAVSILRRRKA